MDHREPDPHQQQDGDERQVLVENEFGRDQAGGLDQRIGAFLEQLVDEVLVAL